MVFIVGSNDYAATKDSDLVIITAGVPRRPGLNWEDLLMTRHSNVADILLREFLLADRLAAIMEWTRRGGDEMLELLSKMAPRTTPLMPRLPR